MSRVDREAVVSREKILGHLGLPTKVPASVSAKDGEWLPGVQTPDDPFPSPQAGRGRPTRRTMAALAMRGLYTYASDR